MRWYQEYDVGGWCAHVLEKKEGEEDWVTELELTRALAFDKVVSSSSPARNDAPF